MLLPTNITELYDKEVMRISLKTNLELYKPKEMLKSWEIEQFKETYMLIKLNLADPILVSSTSDRDTFEMKILDTNFFISSESFKQPEERKVSRMR